MFARHLTIHLKANSVAEFSDIFETQVLPALRAQPGFQDVTVFAGSSGKDVTAISLWDTRENAELYGASAFPATLKMLERVVDGAPRVRISEVLHSTLKPAAAAA